MNFLTQLGADSALLPLPCFFTHTPPHWAPPPRKRWREGGGPLQPTV